MPLLIIPTIGAFYPIFQFKQFLIVLVPLILAYVWVANLMPRTLGLFFINFLLVGSLLSTINQQTHLTKDDWRGAAGYIQGHTSKGDILLCNAGASSLALNLYMDQSIPRFGYPQDYDILRGGWAGKQMTDEGVDRFLSSIIQGQKRVWLVEYAPNFWDPNQLVEKWLGQYAEEMDDQQFGAIRVRLYELPSGAG